VPAPRFFVVAALLVLALAASLVAGWLQWAVMAADVLLIAAFVIDLIRARRTPLAALRRLPPLLVQGAPGEVEIAFESTGGRRVELELWEGLHPALSDGALRQRVAVGPGGTTIWRYEIVPWRRGEHPLAPLMARVLGPWRLARSQRRLLAEERVRVYPRVRWQGRVGRLLALAQRRELGRMPMRFGGAGSEPYALREYRSGDPPNKVHWKATARHGRLISREDSWERGRRLTVLLDCGRSMTTLDGRLSKLDHALAASLALLRVGVGRGDRVTVLAFSDRIERLVRSSVSQRGASEAYEALYDLEARRAEPAFDLATERLAQMGGRGSTVVLFTSVTDLAAAESLRRALAELERRHRTMLVNLEDPELVELAHGAPDSPEESFAKLAALEILLANRRLARRLRHQGIRVVTTAADRLALETLDAYLAMFQTRAA
jgi:uncharacterized protein (DUF58 family)